MIRRNIITMKIIDNYDNDGKKIFANLPDEIPNEKLNREKAMKIHSQTLERLNERGGMSILEIIMNLSEFGMTELFQKYGYNYKPKQKDADELMRLLSARPK